MYNKNTTITEVVFNLKTDSVYTLKTQMNRSVLLMSYWSQSLVT